ncbi:UNVERIFIED_CONTAM: hypothetical protein Slati_0547800 [Sesamum latifolium]|uniref:Reverse transcriptase domain-containing protein n=1 Tax=Sesamum latifolium TaxID=2727402 RepID=A0AAW2Y0S7_9LAMI
MLDISSKLPKHIVIMLPKEDDGEVPCRVDIEYEWVLPKCQTCNSLGHQTSQCPIIKLSTKPPIAVFIPRQKVENEGYKDDRGMIREETIIRATTAPSNPVMHEHVREQPVPLSTVGDGKVLLSDWNWFSDYTGIGNRIWLAWNDDELDVEVLAVHEQTNSYCSSVVYGANDLGVRRDIWRTLSHIADSIDVEPWLLLEDFNAVTDMSEVCGASEDIRSVIEDFQGFLIDTGARGLRQWDPMSPYLFVLVMEELRMLMQKLIDQDRDFIFHWKCRELGLFQLCFADDLLLFCEANE